MMQTTKIQIGLCVLDLSKNELLGVNNSVTHLTQKSCEILKILSSNQGKLVSRHALIDAVWDGNHLIGANRLTDEIWKIRGTLIQADVKNVMIKTVPRKGYILLIESEKSDLKPLNHHPLIHSNGTEMLMLGGAAKSRTVYLGAALIFVLGFALLLTLHTVQQTNLLLAQKDKLLQEQYVEKQDVVGLLTGLSINAKTVKR